MSEHPLMYFVTADEMQQLNERLEDLAEFELSDAATNLIEQIGFVLDEVHRRTWKAWTETGAMTERLKREAAKTAAEGVQT